MLNPTPKVSSRYGAPMGRLSHAMPADLARHFDGKLTLHRIRINRGGYDLGGAYWGIGQPLYWWYADDAASLSGYLRAASREEAKRKIRETYPNARFYR